MSEKIIIKWTKLVTDKNDAKKFFKKTFNIQTQCDLMFIYLLSFSYKHLNKPEEKFG